MDTICEAMQAIGKDKAVIRAGQLGHAPPSSTTPRSARSPAPRSKFPPFHNKRRGAMCVWKPVETGSKSAVGLRPVAEAWSESVVALGLRTGNVGHTPFPLPTARAKKDKIFLCIGMAPHRVIMRVATLEIPRSLLSENKKREKKIRTRAIRPYEYALIMANVRLATRVSK